MEFISLYSIRSFCIHPRSFFGREKTPLFGLLRSKLSPVTLLDLIQATLCFQVNHVPGIITGNLFSDGT